MSHWTSKNISAAYDAFRPQYPADLFKAVASKSVNKELAVDLGCGTGQAVRGLVNYFQRVVGVDPSATQTGSAFVHPNAKYVIGGGESFAKLFPPRSVSCITVAQAVHWFDMPLFIKEVDLSLREDGVLALWNYPLCTILSNNDVDKCLKELDGYLMQNHYWPPQRKHVDDNFKHLLPYFDDDRWRKELQSFPQVKKVSLDNFSNYLSTWSGISEHKKKFPERDLVGEFRAKSAELLRRNNATDDELTLEVSFTMNLFLITRKNQSSKL